MLLLLLRCLLLLNNFFFLVLKKSKTFSYAPKSTVGLAHWACILKVKLEKNLLSLRKPKSSIWELYYSGPPFRAYKAEGMACLYSSKCI